MIKKIMLVCVALILWSTGTCRAGEEKGFGFTAGTVSGLGFARRTIRNDPAGPHGSQWGLILWKIGDEGWADIGYQRISFIDRQERAGLYVLYGSGLWYSAGKRQFEFAPGVYEDFYSNTAKILPGAGFGIEIGLNRQLKLNLELTMTLIISFQDFTEAFDPSIGNYRLDKGAFKYTGMSVNPVPQLSLIYYY